MSKIVQKKEKNRDYLSWIGRKWKWKHNGFLEKTIGCNMKWVLGKREGYKSFDFIDKMGEDVRGERSTRRQILGRKWKWKESESECWEKMFVGKEAQGGRYWVESESEKKVKVNAGQRCLWGKSRRRQILGRMSNMSQSTVVAHRPYDHHGTSWLSEIPRRHHHHHDDLKLPRNQGKHCIGLMENILPPCSYYFVPDKRQNKQTAI